MKSRISIFALLSALVMGLSSCTSDENIVTDIDGNQYKVVRYGYQEWMVENLKVTHYNDGTPIAYAPSDEQWAFADSITKGAWCVYDFAGDEQEALTANSYVTYGALYNFYAVQSGKLAPEGWRVATEEDWNYLQMYMSYNGWNYDETHNGNKVAKAMADNQYWEEGDGEDLGDIGNKESFVSMNNKSGFSALPAGDRRVNGEFVFQGEQAYWWTSSFLPNITSTAWARALSNTECSLISEPSKLGNGFSVRCVRDVE